MLSCRFVLFTCKQCGKLVGVLLDLSACNEGAANKVQMQNKVGVRASGSFRSRVQIRPKSLSLRCLRAPASERFLKLGISRRDVANVQERVTADF